MRFERGGWLALAATAMAASLQATWMHPSAMPQDARYPEAVVAVIEVPAGSFTKYEIDEATGHVFVDRYQSMPAAVTHITPHSSPLSGQPGPLR